MPVQDCNLLVTEIPPGDPFIKMAGDAITKNNHSNSRWFWIDSLPTAMCPWHQVVTLDNSYNNNYHCQGCYLQSSTT